MKQTKNKLYFFIFLIILSIGIVSAGNCPVGVKYCDSSLPFKNTPINSGSGNNSCTCDINQSYADNKFIPYVNPLYKVYLDFTSIANDVNGHFYMQDDQTDNGYLMYVKLLGNGAVEPVGNYTYIDTYGGKTYSVGIAGNGYALNVIGESRFNNNNLTNISCIKFKDGTSSCTASTGINYTNVTNVYDYSGAISIYGDVRTLERNTGGGTSTTVDYQNRILYNDYGAVLDWYNSQLNNNDLETVYDWNKSRFYKNQTIPNVCYSNGSNCLPSSGGMNYTNIIMSNITSQQINGSLKIYANSFVARDVFRIEQDPSYFNIYPALHLFASNPTFRQTVSRPSGGFGFSMFDLWANDSTSNVSANMGSLGMYGAFQTDPSPPIAYFWYLGAGKDTTITNNSLRITPNKYVCINCPDGTTTVATKPLDVYGATNLRGHTDTTTINTTGFVHIADTSPDYGAYELTTKDILADSYTTKSGASFGLGAIYGGSSFEFQIWNGSAVFTPMVWTVSTGRTLIGDNSHRMTSSMDDGKNTVQVNGTLSTTRGIVFKGNYTSEVCNSTWEGEIYYDGSTKKHYGCNSTTWNALY